MTDAHTGEGLADAGIQPGDLVLADRAYGIWREIRVVLDALAYLVIRLTWSNLPLCTLDGQPFDLPTWLRSIPENQQMAEVMVYAADDPQQRPLRLVAGRVPPEKAQETRDAVYRRARKKKRSPHPNTLLAAGFVILLTNLPAHTWPTLDYLGLVPRPLAELSGASGAGKACVALTNCPHIRLRSLSLSSWPRSSLSC